MTTCRKFAPTARNYAAARLMADVGLRVNEARSLDLADVKWELGRFGRLHVRHGKGTLLPGPGESSLPPVIRTMICQASDDRAPSRRTTEAAAAPSAATASANGVG